MPGKERDIRSSRPKASLTSVAAIALRTESEAAGSEEDKRQTSSKGESLAPKTQRAYHPLADNSTGQTDSHG